MEFVRNHFVLGTGDLVTVVVERTLPAHGRVTLIWQITAENSPPANQRFLSTSGTISFNQVFVESRGSFTAIGMLQEFLGCSILIQM